VVAFSCLLRKTKRNNLKILFSPWKSIPAGIWKGRAQMLKPPGFSPKNYYGTVLESMAPESKGIQIMTIKKSKS
jgi:hypothetical protein